MELNIRTLHSDGAVTRAVERSRCRKPTNALLDIGSRLRAADPTVAAVRADEITLPGQRPQWTWAGHYDEQQAAVIAAHDRSAW